MDPKVTSDRLQNVAVSHNLRSIKLRATRNNYKFKYPNELFYTYK